METDVLVPCFMWSPYTVHSKVIGAQLELDVWTALLQSALLAPELHFLASPCTPSFPSTSLGSTLGRGMLAPILTALNF